MLEQLIVDNVKSMNQPKMNVQEVYTVNILSNILGSTFGQEGTINL